MKSIKNKIIVFCLIPISIFAQKIDIGDTLKINQGSMELGEYKYVFWGESTNKKDRADNSIDKSNAVVIATKYIERVGASSNYVIALIGNDTITIWMPFAQENEEAFNKDYVSQEDVFKAFTGTIYKIGDTLRLGEGSMDDGSFKYIRNSSYSFMTVMTTTNNTVYNRRANSLDRDYAGRSVRIKKFEYHGDKKIGRKKYAIVKFDIVAQEVDIDAAIRSGEIIDPNYNQNTKWQPQISVADELKKLNDLKEQGVLSEDEFQAQKKKLLNQ